MEHLKVNINNQSQQVKLMKSAQEDLITIQKLMNDKLSHTSTINKVGKVLKIKWK